MKLPRILVLKILNKYFNSLYPTWYQTFLNYCIDSKFRKYKRLDKFLKDQLDNPVVMEIVNEEAKNIKTYKDSDKQIIAILKYVKSNYAYKHDIANYGITELWANADKIIGKKADDCDGLNSLCYMLARAKGIDQNLLWNAIGDVNGGGHYWLVYMSIGELKPCIYTIDATYWVDFTDIKYRQTFRLTKSKYQTIWYLFNEDHIFKGQ